MSNEELNQVERVEEAGDGVEADGLTKLSVAQDKEKDARTLELSYDFGKDVASAIEVFGEEVVFGFYLKGIKVGLQAYIRRLMKDGKSNEEILENIQTWDPAVRAPRTAASSASKVTNMFAKLTPEEQAALLAKLAEMKKGE